MSTVYFCTRDALILSLSQDAQAQLTNDPLRRWPLGNADGLKTTFLTPFAQATTLKVYKAGVLVETGWTLSSGTGTDGADEVVFTVAPASGAISASADNRAMNTVVIDAARKSVSETIARYLPSGTDITNPWLLGKLEPIAIHLCKIEFRGRRELGVSDSLDLLVKADYEWLRSVRDAKAPLQVNPSSTSTAAATARVGAEALVFGALEDEET